VFISSELEEVLRVSDRVAVLRDRKKVAEYSGDVDDKTLIQAMAGEA
jgi:simple sugar transport system ATP-binding protein